MEQTARTKIKLEAEINMTETKKIIKAIKEQSCFFEKLNKINKLLFKLTKSCRENIHSGDEKNPKDIFLKT